MHSKSRNKTIVKMSIHEAYVMLHTLRSFQDDAYLLDPEERIIWDIDENENLVPGNNCNELWGETSQCKDCASLKSVRELTGADFFKKNGDDFYHIAVRLVNIEGRIFALETSIKMEERIF